MNHFTPLTAEQRAMHDALAKALTDKGCLIEAGFRSLCTMVLDANTSQTQIDEMRRAFMAGAQHLFASMLALMDADREPTANDMRRMSLINDELQRFGDEMRLLASRAEGSA